MAERDPKRDPFEGELQPDPMLQEGRSNTIWMWTVGIVAVVVLALVFFSTTRSDKEAALAPGNDPAAVGTGTGSGTTTGSGGMTPQTGLPGGRGTSDVPPTGQSQPAR
jgi:hypothetical protein